MTVDTGKLLEEMVEAGLPARLVAQAATVFAEVEALRNRRASDAKRQRNRRERHVTSRDVTDRHVMSQASRDGPPSSLPPTPPNITTPPTSLRSEKKNARGIRLPDDWQPLAGDIAFAIKQGLTEQQIADEGGRFRDYWHAKPGIAGTKVDWSATWRNWCRNAIERKGPGPPRTMIAPTFRDQQKQRAQDAYDELRAYNRSRAGSGTPSGVLPADDSQRSPGFHDGDDAASGELFPVNGEPVDQRCPRPAGNVQVSSQSRRNS